MIESQWTGTTNREFEEMSEPKFKRDDVVSVEGRVGEQPADRFIELKFNDGSMLHFTEDQLTLVSRPEPKKYQVLYKCESFDRVGVTERLYESKKDWQESPGFSRDKFVALLDENADRVEE